MKTLLPYRLALAALAAFLFTTVQCHARAYGVTAGGRAYAAGPRGVAVAGPNGSAVAGRRSVAVAGPNGATVARRPVAAPLPAGYIRTVPVGYRTVYYGGYNCYFVGGVYYRAVMYQGDTIYVVVNP